MKGIKIFLNKIKNKKRQYGCERYRNLTEDKKQRIVKYRKILYNTKKKIALQIKTD